jgi:hypothetical protein
VNIRSWLGLTVVPVAAALVTVAGPVAPAGADPGAPQDSKACSPSVDIDSFSDALDKTTFENTFVGNFSALAFDTDGDLLALGDRSSLFTLDPRTKQPTRVVPLADENGRPLDSEAIAVDGDDTRWISSEVEPSIRHYSTDGGFLGQLPVPDALRVAPAGRATTNKTFEGLSLQPDARTLIASVEGQLSGDDPDVRRFQTWTRENPANEFALGPQYAYRADPGLDVSDITPIPDGRLLVVERGFTAGVGNTIHLALADPRHADDVSGVENVTAQTGARFVEKTALADLAQCPTLGATAKQPQPNPLLDNVEGAVVTRTEGDGRLGVLLVSDDNENPSQITRFYSLTVTLPKP